MALQEQDEIEGPQVRVAQMVPLARVDADPPQPPLAHHELELARPGKRGGDLVVVRLDLGAHLPVEEDNLEGQRVVRDVGLGVGVHVDLGQVVMAGHVGPVFFGVDLRRKLGVLFQISPDENRHGPAVFRLEVFQLVRFDLHVGPPCRWAGIQVHTMCDDIIRRGAQDVRGC